MRSQCDNKEWGNYLKTNQKNKNELNHTYL